MVADNLHDDEPETALEGTLLAEDNGGIQILKLSSDRPKTTARRVVLFELDDVQYTVPERPRPTMGLKYLYILAHEGEGQANHFMMWNLLGEEGYKALMDSETITQEEYDQVLNVATKILLGSQDTPKEIRGGGKGRRKSSGR